MVLVDDRVGMSRVDAEAKMPYLVGGRYARNRLSTHGHSVHAGNRKRLLDEMETEEAQMGFGVTISACDTETLVVSAHGDVD